MHERMLGETQSVCPICLERIPAKKVERNRKVYLEKDCPAHGHFSVCIWGGQIPYESFQRPAHKSDVNASLTVKDGCPYDCGICTEHRQKTCCVLLEVTTRCNLCCPLCFASSQGTGRDLSLEEIEKRYTYLMEQGGPFNVQLSGGEPTLRDDLDEIIRMGKRAGISFFQLNTNGIRLAAEPDYVKKLADAGLDCVFLQFDGLEDDIYEALRGRKLLETKLEAIKVCSALNLGVVLVPTIVPGINVDAIGDILSFASAHLPKIRGVHFQPVSYFGRYDQTERAHFTLPDLLEAIEQQTGGQMKMTDFSPGNAENPYCSMSGNYYKRGDGSLELCQAEENGCCGGQTIELSDRAREFVARQWSGQKEEGCSCSKETLSFEDYIQDRNINTLAISAMVFMDAWNLDLERLRQCYIHEVDRLGGRLNFIPFCAYNLTSAEGETLYRGQE